MEAEDDDDDDDDEAGCALISAHSYHCNGVLGALHSGAICPFIASGLALPPEALLLQRQRAQPHLQLHLIAFDVAMQSSLRTRQPKQMQMEFEVMVMRLRRRSRWTLAVQVAIAMASLWRSQRRCDGDARGNAPMLAIHGVLSSAPSPRSCSPTHQEDEKAMESAIATATIVMVWAASPALTRCSLFMKSCRRRSLW